MSDDPDKIRSFTLLGASGSGKTMLGEALLYHTGVIHHLSGTENGNRYLDTEPEEQKRQTTVFSKIQTIPWDQYTLHFADTPGVTDFIGEAIAPLAALDAAVIVVDATVGVDVATKQLFHLAEEYRKPILFFVNKMNKERADFDRTLESIRKNLSRHAHPVALPIGAGDQFRGVLDLIDSRAFVYQDGKSQAAAIPDEEKERFQKAQRALIEEVAETDEVLFDKLAAGASLKKDDILPRLIQDIEAEEIIPVLVGNADPPMGITQLLDTLTHLILSPTQLPEPEAKNPETGVAEKLKVHPFELTVAQIFKIVSDPGMGDVFFLKVATGTIQPGQDLLNANKRERERIGHLLCMQGKDRKAVAKATAGDVVAVAKLKHSSIGDTLHAAGRPIALPAIRFPDPVFSLSLHPKTRKDEDKLGTALGKLSACDPTLRFSIDPEFNETLLSGRGEVHLEAVAARLKDRYGIDLTLGTPHVPYRETVTQKVKAQGKYKKQTGGHGQYGDVWLWLEPRPLGSGFEFVSEIKGGAIPGKYIPSVEKGVQDAIKRGTLAGYPVVDVKVTLFDGSFHAVDSSDLAFQIAGSLAFKQCETEARPILLEPMMRLEVTTPPDYVGAVTNDLNARRGKITGLNQEGDLHVIQAEVPLAEMAKYATDLKGLTHGTGRHRMEFAQYLPVPGHLAAKILQETQEARKGHKN
jgi:elongation factor G